MHTSDFISLPSERTLCDYTQYAGFQDEIDADIKREAGLDDLPDWKKYGVVMMKIKESYDYDKHPAHFIGFVNTGDVGNQPSRLEARCGSADSDP